MQKLPISILYLLTGQIYYTNSTYKLKLYIGALGSSNTVMKSGEDRDRIAVEYSLVAFKMEGAGA